MSIMTAIYTGVRTALTANGTISGQVGTRVYRLLAPGSAAEPYIVMTIAGGGDLNDNPKDEVDIDIDVKAVSGAADTSLTLADAIRTALHDQDITLSGGWATYRMQHEAPFDYVETTEKRQYWHAGGRYRLRAVKEN
jgi:hypothetical protein